MSDGIPVAKRLDHTMPNFSRTALTTRRARQLRRGDNIAEAALWNMLKAKRLGGYKFVRQFPIGPYFADFAQRSRRLVVEVDGSQHFASQHDERRNTYMLRLGYSILRIWSGDLLRNREAVADTILAVLEGRIVSSVKSTDLVYLPALSGPPCGGPPPPQAGEE